MNLTVRTWLWVVFAASLVAGGVRTGWWLSNNISDKEIAQLHSGWDKERAELQKKYAEAEHKNREIEHDRDVAVGRLRDAFTRQRVDLERRHAGTVNRLRIALDKACPSTTGGMPTGPRTPGGSHDPADRDELRGRIAESLKRRVVVPADICAQQVLGLQAYVRALLPDWRPE